MDIDLDLSRQQNAANRTSRVCRYRYLLCVLIVLLVVCKLVQTKPFREYETCLNP